VFLSNTNVNINSIRQIHESSWNIFIPLFILSFISIFIGYLFSDLLIGFGTDFWGTSIFILSKNYSVLDIEFVNISKKLLPFILTVFGITFSYLLYRYGIYNFFLLKKSFLFNRVFYFFNKKWFFDRIYNEYFNQYVLNTGHTVFYNSIDRGLLENIGPTGIVKKIIFFSKLTINIQKESLGKYLIYLICFTILFINIVFIYIFF
jgi:NADH-ubiquinone oxidoreductase chain 5